MKELHNKVSIYIPSINKDGEPIENIIEYNEFVDLFVNTFGGCTTYNCYGHYRDKNNKIIYEDIIKIESFTNLYIDRDWIELKALTLKEKLNQESVSIELNGKMYLVE
jgi:hypothetical protein